MSRTQQFTKGKPLLYKKYVLQKHIECRHILSIRGSALEGGQRGSVSLAKSKCWNCSPTSLLATAFCLSIFIYKMGMAMYLPQSV